QQVRWRDAVAGVAGRDVQTSAAAGPDVRQVVGTDVDRSAPGIGQANPAQLGKEPAEGEGGPPRGGGVIGEGWPDASAVARTPAGGGGGDAAVACGVEVVDAEPGIDDRLATGPAQLGGDEVGDRLAAHHVAAPGQDASARDRPTGG